MDITMQGSLATERPSWLSYDEFPFESRFLEVDGRRIHYIDEGAGPTMLFVHAGPAWSFIFRDLIVRLRGQFRCVALDFPGAGLSPIAADERPSLDEAAHVLEAFVRALDLQDVTLVAHDLGGPVAFSVVARLRHRFAAIVMVESFGWPLLEHHPKTARMLRLVSGPTFKLLNDTTNVLALATATSYGVGRHLSAPGRKAFRGPYRDHRVRRAALAMLGDAIVAGDYLRSVDLALRTVLRDMPVLLVFGAKSPQIKEGFREQWLARFPEAPLLLVAGGHHFPMMDDPDAVVNAIQVWRQERSRSIQSATPPQSPTAMSAR